MNILVSRSDRAGDLILTLPVFQVLRRDFPSARILAHVSSYTAPLLDGRPDVDGVILDDRQGKPFSFLSLAKKMRKMAIDAAVIVHPSRRAVLGCFMAGIPIRAGRASNFWMPLLTHRFHQHRSRNLKHEIAYNLELLEPLEPNELHEPHEPLELHEPHELHELPELHEPLELEPPELHEPLELLEPPELHELREPSEPSETSRSLRFPQSLQSPKPIEIDSFAETPHLFSGKESFEWGRHTLMKSGFGGRPPAFVHPGHGGSAVNLPVFRYRVLVEKLIDAGFPVIVTFGPGEAGLEKEFPPFYPGRLGFVSEIPDLGRLMGLLACGGAFFGGSTGPMHIAAALGIPTVSFFPLLPAMTPVRWGPSGKLAKVVQPAGIACPGNCRGCSQGNCLSAVDLEESVSWAVLNAITKQSFTQGLSIRD